MTNKRKAQKGVANRVYPSTPGKATKQVGKKTTTREAVANIVHPTRPSQSDKPKGKSSVNKQNKPGGNK